MATPGPGTNHGWPREAAAYERPNALITLVTIASLILGLWGRFKGLGAWPLSADEYYIARSVENILQTGLPQWACGGLYMRGLLFQYLVAPLQMAGMSAELSGRFIAALASVLALPAVYLLGRRIHGPTVGLLAVSVLALSAWDVDIARFGRMYAPFQAIFAWYLVYFIRYTVDADSRALRPMIILSVVGVLTWEGGLLLTFANLLPPFIRSPQGTLVARDFRYLALCAAIVAIATVFTMTEMTSAFRRIGTDPFPPGFDVAEFNANLKDDNPAGVPRQSGDAAGPEWRSPFGIVIGLAMLALALASARWIWSFRRRWPTAVGLAVALAAALAHHFSLVAFILIILLLARMLGWRELIGRDAWPFVAAITASIVGWTVIGLLNPGWLTSLATPWRGSSDMLRLAYEFLRLPDFIRIVALPFARSAPVLGVVLSAAIAIAILRTIRRNSAAVTAEQVLLLMLVGMLGAVSFSHPPRLETRYVFFLFPGLVVVAVTLVAQAIEPLFRRRVVATLVTITLVAAGFFLTGDFQPRRLMHLEGAPTQIARRSAPGEKSNIMHRTDPRSAAQWLTEHVTDSGTLVINGYPTVDFYYRNFDYAYIGLDNRRYVAYACQRGTLERWGGLPLLNDAAGLDAQIARSDNAFIVIDTVSRDALLQDLAAWHPRVAWTSLDGSISVLAIMRNQQT